MIKHIFEFFASFVFAIVAIGATVLMTLCMFTVVGIFATYDFFWRIFNDRS